MSRGPVRRIDRAARMLWPAALAGLAAMLISLTPLYDAFRERLFDQIAPMGGGAATDAVVVVDIDRATLDAHGGWPLPRERMAELLEAVAAAKPLAVGLDVLLEGADRNGPAALARRLGGALGRNDISALAETLPDADRRIGAAMALAPSVAGVVFGPGPDAAGRPVVLERGRLDTAGLWREPGLAGPPEAIAAGAAGLGLIAIKGDPDGVTRRMPLLVVAGERLTPGFALELVRLANRAPQLLVDGAGRTAAAGAAKVPLGEAGLLRLTSAGAGGAARVSASGFLARDPGGAAASVAGRIAIIGVSAPEAGGLRVGPGGALVPAVMLQAAAVGQLLAGRVPLRPAVLRNAEFAGLGLAALAGGALGAAYSPVLLAAAGLLAAGLALAAMAAWLLGHVLVDPLGPPAALLAGFAASAIVAAFAARRREARVRQRFEQHLAPEVVAALAAAPDAMRLEGHMREITALFTDLEGFTAMTARAEPRELIRLLDAYFDGICAILVAEGGMIDKIVGDAVHAIFNAPLDLASHPAKALAAAGAIARFGEAFRREPGAARLSFGRTRIGFETGQAIVGDVGGRRKLDYTAHGDAVNAAARLEAANKELGTTIAIGHGAAHRIGVDSLRCLGPFRLRGRERLDPVYAPWPEAMPEDHRQSERRAVELWRAGDARSLILLRDLASQRPEDAALRGMVDRASAGLGQMPESRP